MHQSGVVWPVWLARVLRTGRKERRLLAHAAAQQRDEQVRLADLLARAAQLLNQRAAVAVRLVDVQRIHRCATNQTQIDTSVT